MFWNVMSANTAVISPLILGLSSLRLSPYNHGAPSG